jgi:sRNA-binding carbon storage regulator CsrA
MLVVSRRTDEAIEIELADGANGDLTLKDLFAKGPIEITLLGGNGRRVKVGIAAPPELSIRRVGRDDASKDEPTEQL